MKNIILASTSTIYKSGYLEYLLDSLKEHFKAVKELTFIPFARPNGISHNEYTSKVNVFFKQLNIKTKGLHESDNPIESLKNAEAIFVGGGNTFVLLNQLYKLELLPQIRETVRSGIPYLGCSAGSNLGGLSIGTTNDMPIVYPPSFAALGFVPFNINPHYLDPIPDSKHMGESRETRIGEFHKFNPQPVIGLREGSWLEIRGEQIFLRGNLEARIFESGKAAYEISPNSDLSNLN